jgi:allantoinase
MAPTFSRAIAGRLLDDEGNLSRGEVVINGSEIVAVTEDIGGASVERREDVGDALILPGMIDAHVHCLSDSGEGIVAGTSSAAAGGVTTIVEMPFDGTGPINSTDRLLTKIDLVNREAVTDVALLGTVNPDGGWTEIGPMVENGAVGFKVSTFNTDSFRFPRSNEWQLRNIASAIAAANSIVCVHAESDDIIRPLLAKAENASSEDPLVHGRTRPGVAEEMAVATMLAVASEAGARLHLCHLSLPRSVRLTEWHRASEGTDVTVETCPHYLTFTEDDVTGQRGRLKINPPIRGGDAKEGLWDLIDSGVIDVIASDHAPWSVDKKAHRRILDNHSGAPGVETIYPLVLSQAWQRGPRTLARVIRAVTSTPAERFALAHRKGRLQAGYDADLAIFDTSLQWTIDEAQLHSNAGWSPYHGLTLSGRIVRTILRGADIWDGESITTTPGFGQFLRPKR